MFIRNLIYCIVLAWSVNHHANLIAAEFPKDFAVFEIQDENGAAYRVEYGKQIEVWYAKSWSGKPPNTLKEVGIKLKTLELPENVKKITALKATTFLDDGIALFFAAEVKGGKTQFYYSIYYSRDAVPESNEIQVSERMRLNDLKPAYIESGGDTIRCYFSRGINAQMWIYENTCPGGKPGFDPGGKMHELLRTDLANEREK